ncbi:hypothetical protein GPUN_2302 [Glaciecola punicea ACAM 611]|jgi:hypothetical protein|uniref:DUF1289 domain-containing protein n=1 Tax=Glaciecola punicea ACAM 611 TaxID=1121923 RepID=H5TDP0_9ALTE|nr:DUF1289 domain-containing protein [Glaciecola punicea]OFA32448.1 Fe-S oxidoreductase [Glaciecola punicea]GAB56417.1 hypothetical protein GPUN_2302 [Glaciecola punicea ACAM 611]
MQQMEFFIIPSPCIGICESGPRGYCIGCFRSREERTHWQDVDDHTKRIIVSACNRRKKAFNARKAKSKDSDIHFQQDDLF